MASALTCPQKASGSPRSPSILLVFVLALVAFMEYQSLEKDLTDDVL